MKLGGFVRGQASIAGSRPSTEGIRPLGTASDRFDVRSTRSLARVSGLTNAGSVSRFSLVRAPELEAEVLLPTVTSRLTSNPLQLYASLLERENAFSGQRDALRRLSRLDVSFRPAEQTQGRPRVALLVPEPSELLQGRSEPLMLLVHMLWEAGCQPVLVPPMAHVLMGESDAAMKREISSMVKMFDGVIGPGGRDVHPRVYRSKNRHSEHVRYGRDRFEAAVAMEAMNSHCFLLGICRSHQLWNAARGGDLVQDVEAEGLVGVTHNQRELGSPGHRPHVIRDEQGNVRYENRMFFEPGTQLAAIAEGLQSTLVNSFHHQAVKASGQDMQVLGVVPDDQTGHAAIEATERWNAITVQFHPEMMMQEPLFARLTQTVARRAHIFSLLRRLDGEGRASPSELAREMKRQPERFHASDFAWVKEHLSAHLEKRTTGSTF